MSEIKHTPWHVTLPTESMHAVRNIRGAIVADVGYSNTLEENDCNARLIAAAPELLEAAQIALTYIEAVCFNTPNAKKRNNYADSASIIRAAIAKATGSQS
jgi:hypothetical protein